MKRIVLDQGLQAPPVSALLSEGWDVLHVREMEMHQAADTGIPE